MNINEAYPSKWLKAADLEGPTVATIRTVTLEDMQQSGGQKPVVFFEETGLGLVLNKTNANMIAAILKSGDTDTWTGKKIGLRVEQVNYQGTLMPSIRVFDPAPPKAGGFGKKPGLLPASTPAQQDDVPDSWEDSIPEPDYPPKRTASQNVNAQ